MRILLVRHGESEGNVDPRLYIEKGDANISLTDTGWRQAVGTGRFLEDYYTRQHVNEWPAIYLSSYQRPKETLSGIVHGLGGYFRGTPKLYEDPRLIEKFFGAASAMAFPDDQMNKDVIDTMLRLSKKVYAGDPFAAKHLFGDSTKDTLVAVKSLIDGSLRRDVEEGKYEFLFVAHGAVIQSFIMCWAHVQMRDKNKIGNPGNGDVIAIIGEPKNWTVTKIYDGEKGEKVDINLLENIRPFSAADLPPVPDSIAKGP